MEAARAFRGFDFSNLLTRHLDAPPLWNYADEVARAAVGATIAVDFGTGGGERLAEMRSSLPQCLIATEEWHVNAPLARDRLAPLGVPVVRADSLRPPFRDGAFDLVLSRHEAIEPAEVARILRQGGVFVTQQVGKHNWHELASHFLRRTDFGDHRTRYACELEAAGLTVRSWEHERRIAYPSLGEFAYQLAVDPELIPGFDIEADLEALLTMERECLGPEGFVVTECRYLLTARKT
jgi:SAM-dependent methyltransferase